jgi:hypothetical protein
VLFPIGSVLEAPATVCINWKGDVVKYMAFDDNENASLAENPVASIYKSPVCTSRSISGVLKEQGVSSCPLHKVSYVREVLLCYFEEESK